MAHSGVTQCPLECRLWGGQADPLCSLRVLSHLTRCGWRGIDDQAERLRLLWTQALHWTAVLVAMHLMFVADVARMMNVDAEALSVLTLLALGTFTAGVHIGAWRICLIGLIFGIAVPGIAWLEQSALFLLLSALALIAIAAPLFWRARQRHRVTASLIPTRRHHDVPDAGKWESTQGSEK